MNSIAYSRPAPWQSPCNRPSISAPRAGPGSFSRAVHPGTLLFGIETTTLWAFGGHGTGQRVSQRGKCSQNRMRPGRSLGRLRECLLRTDTDHQSTTITTALASPGGRKTSTFLSAGMNASIASDASPAIIKCVRRTATLIWGRGFAGARGRGSFLPKIISHRGPGGTQISWVAPSREWAGAVPRHSACCYVWYLFVFFKGAPRDRLHGVLFFS